jgi:hypothetical protein
MRAISLLLMLTPLSYLPLVRNLLALQSTNGISITSTLLLALCSQAQLATMYYLWRCPDSKRDGNIVPKPPRLIDYINLSQIGMQWICSLVLYAPLALRTALFITHAPSSHTSLNQRRLYILLSFQTPTQTDTKRCLILLTLHALLFIFAVLITPAPRDDWLDLAFVMVMCFNQYIINPIITICTATFRSTLLANLSGLREKQWECWRVCIYLLRLVGHSDLRFRRTGGRVTFRGWWRSGIRLLGGRV